MVTIHTRISQNPNKENTTKPMDKLVALGAKSALQEGTEKTILLSKRSTKESSILRDTNLKIKIEREMECGYLLILET